MAKRSARGRQQLRSAKSTRTSEGNRKNDDIDWNISSGDESGEEDLVLNSVSDHSEKEEEEEVKETIEEKKLRLAKEYLNKVRLEEEEASGSDATDDEGVEERIEKRLQREAEEVGISARIQPRREASSSKKSQASSSTPISPKVVSAKAILYALLVPPTLDAGHLHGHLRRREIHRERWQGLQGLSLGRGIGESGHDLRRQTRAQRQPQTPPIQLPPRRDPRRADQLRRELRGHRGERGANPDLGQPRGDFGGLRAGQQRGGDRPIDPALHGLQGRAAWTPRTGELAAAAARQRAVLGRAGQHAEALEHRRHHLHRHAVQSWKRGNSRVDTGTRL